MRITIVSADHLVGIDGVFRSVDLSGIDPDIRVVSFDTGRGAGQVEYLPGAIATHQVRDHEAEDAAWATARAAGKPEHEIEVPVMTKVVPYARPPEQISDLAPFRLFIDAWHAATMPEPTAEELAAKERAAANAAVVGEIASLEYQQASPRRLREILVRNLPAGADRDYLAGVDAQIVSLRQKIRP